MAALHEHRAGRLDAERAKAAPVPSKPWLQPSPHDFPPAGSLTIRGELRRFTPGKAISLWSPLLAEMLADGLIERVYDPAPPCLCLGFRLTDKGMARR
jgi:hypothetical protein